MVFHLLSLSKNNKSIYPLIFHDIFRVIILQVTTHILFYISHNNIPLISKYLLETLLFMIASLFVYWFCFYTLFPVKWDISNTISPNYQDNYQKKEVMSFAVSNNTHTNDDKSTDILSMDDNSDTTPSVISFET